MKNILTLIIALALFVPVCSAKCTDIFFNAVTQRDSTMDLDSAVPLLQKEFLRILIAPFSL